VFATDADGNGPAGLVKYSIVSKHNKFKIDPNTGWLTTNAVSLTILKNNKVVTLWGAAVAQR
jgi:hypothetical protein